MSLAKTSIQDRIGLSYIQSIIHYAGYNLSINVLDHGIDGTITRIQKTKKGNRDSPYKLDFQLKTSCNFKEDDTFIKYDLEMKNYDDLIIDPSCGVQRILILVTLPKEQEKWIQIFDSHAEFRNYAVWGMLSGLPEQDNDYKKRIKFDAANRFDMNTIDSLLDAVERGDIIEKNVELC